MYIGKEQRIQIYKVIKTYEKVNYYKYIGSNFRLECFPNLYWVFEPFLKYLKDNNLISETDCEVLLKNESSWYPDDEIYENYLTSSFDYWYTNYICDCVLISHEIQFEDYYNGLKKEIINDSKLSSKEFDMKLNTIDTDFERMENKYKSKKTYISISKSNFYSLEEYIDCLSEICNNELELNIIKNIRKILNETNK